jgi:peptidoglycan/LPS O-acetylase OafA/YrhL
MATQRAPAFHIPCLDGIRALSIAIVFVSHAGLGHVVPGGFGVTVFFFLSGFLISTLLRREFSAKGTLSFRNFYLRRALRILPPFYAALLFATLFVALGLLPGTLDFRGIGLLAAHIGNYLQIYWPEFGIPQGTGVYWSLAVEEHYYLTFPLLAWWLLRRNSLPLTASVLASIGLSILVWRLILVHQGASVDRTYLATDTRLDSILWGAFLALVMNPVLDPVRSLGRSTKAFLLLGAFGVLLFCFVHRSESFRETYRYTLQGLALLPIFYLCVVDSRSWAFRWLDHPWLRYLGRLSYTLYLVHHVLLYAVAHLAPSLPGFFQAILAALASLLTAALSDRYLEQPMAALRRKYR